MISVNILAQDKEQFEIFHLEGERLPFHYNWTVSIDELKNHIREEPPHLLFLISADADLLFDWVQALKKFLGPFSWLCFTPKMNAKNKELLWQAGASDIIELPIHKKELAAILKSFAPQKLLRRNDETQGSLSDFNLINLIQFFEDKQKTGKLHLQKANASGYIAFKKGNIVNAALNGKTPIDSIETMALWSNGKFWFQPSDEKFKEKVKLENSQIILACMQEMNSIQKLEVKLPNQTQKLFTAPNFNYEEVGPELRVIIKEFKNGNSIKNIKDKYIDNPALWMKHLARWVKNGWLLDEESYHENLKRIQELSKESGMKKLFGKIFSAKDDENLTLEAQKMNSETLINSNADQLFPQRAHLFNHKNLVNNFLNALEKYDV
jgi:DNA-binding response OmpR family regulator